MGKKHVFQLTILKVGHMVNCTIKDLAEKLSFWRETKEGRGGIVQVTWAAREKRVEMWLSSGGARIAR